MPQAELREGDRVVVASGDYDGRTGFYEGRCEVTGAYLVHLDGDAIRDPAVQCDRVEPAPERER